ncbi:MAG: site-2 protease family protein, partial [Bacteroidota bacterium]
QMFRGKIKASESLGSFISIGQMYGPSWNWRRFWSMTAMLSALLGFVNLLPIPGLDGGHVMFLLWEVITRRKPSEKVLEYSTLAGFLLLVGLMIYSFGLDLMRNI